jgi:hypothetical protein
MACIAVIIIVSVVYAQAALRNASVAHVVPRPSPNNDLPSPASIVNLSNWELDEPVASGSSVRIISPSKLAAGYMDQFFYTSTTPSGNVVTFFTPENGAHTKDSKYPRTELRELTVNGAHANWNMNGTNVLTATLKATSITTRTVIGQVHIGTALPGSNVATSTKPLLELYYYQNGSLVLGLEKSPSGSQTTTPVGMVPVGTTFTYMIKVSGDIITIKINDNPPTTLTASPGFKAYGMYFKAGDYLQTTGSSSDIGAQTEFYALTLQH